MNRITFRTLKDHTAQEVFDFIYARVIEQGEPCVRALEPDPYTDPWDGNGYVCEYSYEGKHCAAGMLLEKDEPLAGNINRFKARDLELIGWNGQTHSLVIAALQGAHDKAAISRKVTEDGCENSLNPNFINEFKVLAKAVADQFKLQTNVLDR